MVQSNLSLKRRALNLRSSCFVHGVLYRCLRGLIANFGTGGSDKHCSYSEKRNALNEIQISALLSCVITPYKAAYIWEVYSVEA